MFVDSKTNSNDNMEEIMTNIISTTINSFDFAFCATVNVATYVLIKWISEIRRTKLSTWTKRIILIVVGLIVGFIYYFTDIDIKVIVNSFILAPVSWSWIFKPICNKLNISYKSK